MKRPALLSVVPLLALLPLAALAAPRAQVEVIDGHKLESVTLRKAGSPAVVVFENGSRATLDDKWLFFSNTVQREIDLIHATGETIVALPGIDDKPIIRLVNRPLSKTAVGVDFGAFNQDAQTRDFVRALYPSAKTIVADSSHQMQLTSPALVADAIREVLAASPVSHKEQP